MTDNDFDPVHRPKGYNSHPSGVEAIEVGRHLTADWFNAFKYVFRAEHKNGKQDLDKALWYAKDALTHNFPVHAPTWRFEHQQKLQRVIDFETYPTRETFFKMILIGNRSAATMCIEMMIKEYPSE